MKLKGLVRKLMATGIGVVIALSACGVGAAFAWDIAAYDATPTETKAIEGTAYVSIAVDGAYATSAGADSGTLMSYVPVDLAEVSKVDLADYGLEGFRTDLDGDGYFDVTMLHLFVYAHQQFCADGADGFSASLYTSDWGSSLSISKFWGVENGGNVTYWLDGAMTNGTADQVALADGSDVEAYSYSYAYYSDPNNKYFHFSDGSKTQHEATAYAGIAHEFSLVEAGYDSSWNFSEVAAAGRTVSYGKAYGTAEGSATTDENGNASLTFDEAGTYYVWAEGLTGTAEGLEGKVVSAPACVAVTVEADVCIDLATLTKGLYSVTGFQVDEKDDYTGMINVDPTDVPAYIYVDADGAATLLARVYNPNKYDYVWKGRVADRPDSSATDQMIEGTPILADADYVASGLQKAQVFSDKDGVYGIAGAVYKAMLFEIPLTAEDLAAGKVYFSIRRTPGLTDKGGQWMGTGEHYFLVEACEAAEGVDAASWALDSGDVAEAIELANAIPYEPTAADLEAYVAADEAYIALDYSAGKSTKDYGRAYLDVVVPEVKAKLEATDAAIPNIVPADGTYVFTQTLTGYNYPSTAIPFVSDSLWSTVMTVKDGKMTLQIAQRRGSYAYVMAALPSEAYAAQTAAGDSGKDASNTPGASDFLNETTVYLDNPQTGTDPVDATIEFAGPGEYPMYTGTIEIASLEKPVAISFLGSAWYNRSFVFTQDNMFTADAAGCIRIINKLVNSPDPDDVTSLDEPYKVDASLLTDADKATAEAAAAAYLALAPADKVVIDSRNILTTPEGAADAQTYGQALAVAAEKFDIDIEEGDTPELAQAEIPVAVTGLVYNGEEQVGVADGEGYTVEGGSGTKPGEYVATVKLLDGYVWDDDTYEDKLVTWSITLSPDTPITDIEAGEFYLSADNDRLGTDALAGLDGEDALAEALGLSLCCWDDDEGPAYLEYGFDFRVSGWYRWDDGEDGYAELGSLPADAGYYQVEVEGIGLYEGRLTAYFEVYDAYDVGNLWYLDLDSWSVDYDGGALVYPGFRVYAYDDDWDEADVDADEYEVKVMREVYDDEEGDYAYEEVADGDLEPGRYFLRVVPAEGSALHGYLEEGFSVVDPYDVANAWGLELESGSADYDGGALVLPDFRVYAYDDEGDEVDVDAAEYGVKVVRAAYDDDEYGGDWVPTDEEVADGEYEPGYYFLRVVPAAGSVYHGYLEEEFQIVDPYNIGYAWNLGLDTWSVFADGGARVLPGFRVYAYDDEWDAVDVDAAEYGVKVMRAAYDEDEEEWVPTDEEVADGGFKPGYYFLRVVPAAGGAYHGYLEDGFRIADPFDLAYAEVEGLWRHVVKGSETVTPTLFVTLAGKELVEGRDYELSYNEATYEGDEWYWDDDYIDGDATAAPLGSGTYKATLKGVGDYIGEWSEHFTVGNVFDLDTATFELNRTSYPYTGDPVKLDYVLTAYDGTQLVEGKDYKLLYSMYDELGGPDDGGGVTGDPFEDAPADMNGSGDWDSHYAVYAVGLGDYSGSSSVELFRIVEPNDLEAAVVKVGSSRYAYTGGQIKPSFEVLFPDGDGFATLEKGKDYTASYRGQYVDEDGDWGWGDIDAAVNVGEYAIRVEAAEDGDYEGSQSVSFYVCKSLDGATVTVADQAYTGAALKPQVTVTLDGAVVPASCYEVAYGNNVGEGTATVTVTGLLYDDDYEFAGYMGAATGTFKIVDEAPVAAAIAKIDAIGKVTAASGEAIAAARAAYDALSSDQKALVSADQLARLTSAESAYAKAVADEAVAEAAAKLKAASTINKATVKASDVKKASDLGATTVTLGAKVRKIAKNAFKGTKITTVIVKSAKLKKKSVKNAFKGSKVKTVKVPSAKKKAYKKIFVKKVVGKKVKVK